MRAKGRSPHGERGLKFVDAGALRRIHRSLPTRGAWIEMHIQSVPAQFRLSLPTRGAWIEIYNFSRKEEATPSLPTRGAWIEIGK